MDPYTYLSDLPGMLPDVPQDSILSRTVFADGQMKAVLFRFAAGEELSEHTSTQTAIMYFVEGEADVTLGGDAVEARPGTWIHMQPHLEHSIRARTPVTMLLLMIQPPGGE
jgi:quercetin dioxygenase-like cupin family protein